MNKTVKTILKITGLMVIALILSFVGFLFRVKMEANKMRPAESQILNNEVLIIKDDFVNMFLIKGNDGYIAIDAGNDAESIKNSLEKSEIQPNDIKAVLLTHTDNDHTGALELFKNADLYVPDKEVQLLDGTTARALYFIGTSIDRENYKTLSDKQTVFINGTKIQSYNIKGHTPGSTCYLINDKYLFTGDAISLHDNQIKVFNDFFNMDTEMAEKSIPTLMAIPNVEYLMTGHHGFCKKKEAITN